MTQSKIYFFLNKNATREKKEVYYIRGDIPMCAVQWDNLKWNFASDIRTK